MEWFHSLESDTQSAIKWFAAEFKYLKELRDELEQIKRDTAVSEQERDYKRIRHTWYYIGRCERRAERKVQLVIDDLKKAIQTNPNFVILEKQIEISSEKLLKAFSFYTGDFKNKLVNILVDIKIRKERFGDPARKAEMNMCQIADEAKQYINTLIQWVGGLEVSLKNISTRSLDDKDVEEYVKKKIIDISKPGTFIHLTSSRNLIGIWENGIKLGTGSAIMLGPIISNITGRPGPKEITLETISSNSEHFGYNYGWEHGEDLVKGKELIPKRTILNNYVDYGDVGDAILIFNFLKSYKKVGLSLENEIDSKTVRVLLARFELFFKKYPDKDLVKEKYGYPGNYDPENRKFMDLMHYQFIHLFYEGSRPKFWDVGIIINPKYARSREGRGYANEYNILTGPGREQILGIMLRISRNFDVIKDAMFRLTRKNPKDRVPIYYANGEVAWPR